MGRGVLRIGTLWVGWVDGLCGEFAGLELHVAFKGSKAWRPESSGLVMAELTFSGDGGRHFKPVTIELIFGIVCVLPVERSSCVIPYSCHP